MANAEQAALAAAIDVIGNNELVEVGAEVAEQRGKMRVVMNTLMARVYSETDAKLEMAATLDDKDMYFEAVVRCCSEEALNDDVPADGWGLTKSIVEKKEIIAVFGVGTDGKGLVEFKGVCATSGKRARSSTALMLPTLFEASTSSFVWFKAEDGRVRRGRILWFCVYLPPTSGKALMPECGGQVVLFAHVFNAVDVEWHVVVCIPIKPTPFCPNSPCSVCCTAQSSCSLSRSCG